MKKSIGSFLLCLLLIVFSFSRNAAAITCGVPAASTDCDATNGDDSILITRCDSPATDCVRVEDQNSFDELDGSFIFVLNVNGLGGNDEIQVNLELGEDYSGEIFIHGGDPTASDLFIINGHSNSQDVVSIRPITIDGGNVLDSTGLFLPYDGIEQFIYNGQGGPDQVTIGIQADDDQFSHFPGMSLDEGKIQTFSVANSTNLLPVQYEHVGTNGQITFDSPFPDNDNSLTLQGTQENDLLQLDLATSNFSMTTAQGVRTPIFANNIHNFTIETLSGNNTVNLNNLASLQGTVNVNGGNEEDKLFFAGGTSGYLIDTSIPVVLALPNGSGIFSGIEEIALEGGGSNVTVNGKPSNDHLTYTPDSLNGGSFQEVEENPLFTLQNVGAFSVDLMGGANDILNIEASSGSDIINLTNPGTPQVGVQGLLPVSFSNVELLTVNGGTGDDTFNVIGLAGTGVLLDGGPHAGGDTLNFDAQGLTVAANSSSIVATGRDPVSYFNIENVTLNNATFTQPPPGGTVQFSAGVFRFFENDVFATVTATRNGDGVGEVSVDFATSDGSGVANTDYLPTHGTLTWPNGVTGERSFEVPLIDNELNQPTARTVNLTLSNFVTSGGAELGSTSTALLLISDNEGIEGRNVGGGGGCSMQDTQALHSKMGLATFLILLVILRIRWGFCKKI